jgi:hypothetical protein
MPQFVDKNDEAQTCEAYQNLYKQHYFP